MNEDKNEKEKTTEEFLAAIKTKNKKDYPFFCTICSVGFYQKDFMSHRKKHANFSEITCPLCSREFEAIYIAQFFRHYCTGTKSRQFTCNICSRKLKNAQALANHQRTHVTDTSTYICEICDVTFATQQKLYWHFKNGMHTDKKTKKLKFLSFSTPQNST